MHTLLFSLVLEAVANHKTRGTKLSPSGPAAHELIHFPSFKFAEFLSFVNDAVFLEAPK